MANILQEYIVGESFNTYTKTELSTSDWNWDYRTLVGLIDKDGTKYDLGSPIKFDEQEAALSGVWELNKVRYINISAVGISGSITVKVSQTNYELPLADAEHPYISAQEHVLNPGDSFILSTYVQHNNINNRLSIDISANTDTLLKSIAGVVDIDSKHNTIRTHNDAQWKNFVTSKQIGIVKHNETTCNSIWTPSDLAKPETIVTVDFTSTGVLTYYPNTNTLNPAHS